MTVLRNFDDAIDNQGSITRLPVRTEVPEVTQEVIVRLQPSQARGFAGKDSAEWSWSDLRDYVVHHIEQRSGTFARDAKKEYGIFRGFLSRWGSHSGVISEAAFEVFDGRWGNEPVTITRWCKGSDPFFATPIAKRLGIK
jgi:hypothetical protein